MRHYKIGLFIAAIAFMASTSLVQAQHHRGHGHENKKEWKHPGKKKGHQYAQYRGHHDKHNNRRPVYWARPHRYAYRHHVYFPDYHMFYDPYRNGYVYQSRGRWIYSPTIPSFYANVNFGNARIEVLKSLPINRRPDYSYYPRRYPRNSRVNVNVSF